MAKAKSTTGMGKEHEEAIVKIFSWDNAHRSKSSGASFHDRADVTSNNMVIECEATENKSYSITLENWNEVLEKAHSGKHPGWAIRFRDIEHGKHTDLILMSAHDVSELLEEVETYREMAVK